MAKPVIARSPEEARLEELRELNRRHAARRRRSLILAWAAGWFRAPARAAAHPLPEVGPGEVGIAFGGHATVLLRAAGVSVVCDPMLGRRVGWVRRAVEPGLSPAELADARLILISHAHPDHLHRPTLAELPTSATIVVPRRSADLVAGLGFQRIVEALPGQRTVQAGLEVIATPVRHPTRDQRGAVGYLIRPAGDRGPSVFFCGDSGYFPGFAEIGRRFRPDIALLPIGGYLPRSFRERHMSPLDALYALEDLGARMLIPIHYGAFALSYEHLEDPLSWLRALVAERRLERWVTILAPGESQSFR